MYLLMLFFHDICVFFIVLSCCQHKSYLTAKVHTYRYYAIPVFIMM